MPLSSAGQRPRASVSRACQCATFGTLTRTAPPRLAPAVVARRRRGGRVGEVLEHVGEHDEVEGARLERQAGVLERALHDVVGDLAPRPSRRSPTARGRRGATACGRSSASSPPDAQPRSSTRPPGGSSSMRAVGDRAVAEGGVRLRLGLVELGERGIGHPAERIGARLHCGAMPLDARCALGTRLGAQGPPGARARRRRPARSALAGGDRPRAGARARRGTSRSTSPPACSSRAGRTRASPAGPRRRRASSSAASPRSRTASRFTRPRGGPQRARVAVRAARDARPARRRGRPRAAAATSSSARTRGSARAAWSCRA